MKRLIFLLSILLIGVAPLHAAFDGAQAVASLIDTPPAVSADSTHEQALLNGRVYDPQIGRFLSPDPVISDDQNLQTYNRYSYCRNNPLTYTDPDGYRECVITPAQASQLKDSAPYINRRVNAYASAVLGAVKSGQITSAQAPAYFHQNIVRGADAFGNNIELSRGLESRGSDYVVEGVSNGSIYDGGIPIPDAIEGGEMAKMGAMAVGLARLNDNKVVVWSDQAAIADGINVGGNAVGTDKMDHMFDVGFSMFDSGMDQDQARTQSDADEQGLSGMTSSGIYSNADIEANVAGVAFYQALLAAAESGNDFNFDINDYNVSGMDENQNQNGRRPEDWDYDEEDTQ